MPTPSKSGSSLHPYLFFEGRAEEAIGFYKQTFGAQVEMLLRYGESPEPPPPEKVPPAMLQKIQHASLRIGDSMLSLSDGHCSGKTNFSGFAVTLVMQDADAVRAGFTALSEGGEVIQPLIETFFTPTFGMVTDKFGVMWMLYVPR